MSLPITRQTAVLPFALRVALLTVAAACGQAQPLPPEASARAADGLRATEERSFDLRDVLGRYYPTNPARPSHERQVFNAAGTLDSVLSRGGPLDAYLVSAYDNDASGDPERITVVSEDDGLLLRIEMTDDGAVTYDSTGAVTRRERYRRDAAARVEHVVVSVPGEGDYEIALAYDGEGRLARQRRQHPDGSLRELQTYTYNDRDELATHVTVTRYTPRSPPDTVTLAYTYGDHDAHGRWRRRDETRDGGPPRRRTYRALTYADEPAPPSAAEVRALRGRWRSRTDGTVVELGMEGGPFSAPDQFAWLYEKRFHAEGPVFGIAPGELLFVSRFDVPARRYRYERLGENHITLTPEGADEAIELWRDPVE